MNLCEYNNLAKALPKLYNIFSFEAADKDKNYFLSKEEI